LPQSFHLDRRAADLAAQLLTGTADPDQLLDTKQTAKLLGLSDQWVEIGRHRGYGPRYIKLSSRRIRYRRQDIIAWLDERAHASTSEYASAGGPGRRRKEVADAAQ
jgi:predicted DNA-binding transcriptional regulator AlpA